MVNFQPAFAVPSLCPPVNVLNEFRCMCSQRPRQHAPRVYLFGRLSSIGHVFQHLAIGGVCVCGRVGWGALNWFKPKTAAGQCWGQMAMQAPVQVTVVEYVNEFFKNYFRRAYAKSLSANASKGAETLMGESAGIRVLACAHA